MPPERTCRYSYRLIHTIQRRPYPIGSGTTRPSVTGQAPGQVPDSSVSSVPIHPHYDSQRAPHRLRDSIVGRSPRAVRVERLGLLGCGELAGAHLRLLARRLAELREVVVYDLERSRADNLVQRYAPLLIRSAWRSKISRWPRGATKLAGHKPAAGHFARRRPRSRGDLSL